MRCGFRTILHSDCRVVDGVRWEKYNDLTTEGVFEGSDPVFGPDPDGDFDARSVQVGRLVATPANWFWSAWVFLPAVDRPRSAWLPDLVNWERRGEALRESDIPVPNAGLHTIKTAYIDNQLELFVEMLTDVDSAVWRATAPFEAVTG